MSPESVENRLIHVHDPTTNKPDTRVREPTDAQLRGVVEAAGAAFRG